VFVALNVLQSAVGPMAMDYRVERRRVEQTVWQTYAVGQCRTVRSIWCSDCFRVLAWSLRGAGDGVGAECGRRCARGGDVAHTRSGIAIA